MNKYKKLLKELLVKHKYSEYCYLIDDLDFNEFYNVKFVIEKSISNNDFKMVEKVLTSLTKNKDNK